MLDDALFRSYFGNDISVLGVDLSNGSKIPNYTEHFIDLQATTHTNTFLNAKYHFKVTFLSKPRASLNKCSFSHFLKMIKASNAEDVIPVSQ